MNDAIKDMYKPTGSTTTALVGLHLTHFASKLLQSNSYVRCLMIDFTKVFDTVDHAVRLSTGWPKNGTVCVERLNFVKY